MNIRDARDKLRAAASDVEPADLPLTILKELSLADVPKGASFQVGRMRDRCLHLDWSGRFYRDGPSLIGEADHR